MRLSRPELYTVGCNVGHFAATVLLLYNEEFCDQKKISIQFVNVHSVSTFLDFMSGFCLNRISLCIEMNSLYIVHGEVECTRRELVLACFKTLS